jgi:hypothetical protein
LPFSAHALNFGRWRIFVRKQPNLAKKQQRENQMNNLKCLILIAMLALGGNAACADTSSSFVGTLSTPEDFFSKTIAVTTNFVCNVGAVGHLVAQ